MAPDYAIRWIPNVQLTGPHSCNRVAPTFTIRWLPFHAIFHLAVVASVHGYHWYTEPIAVRAEVASSTAHQVTLKLNENDVSGSQYMDIGNDTVKPGDTQWRLGENVTVYFTRKDGAQSVVRGNGDLLTPVIVVRP